MFSLTTDRTQIALWIGESKKDCIKNLLEYNKYLKPVVEKPLCEFTAKDTLITKLALDVDKSLKPTLEKICIIFEKYYSNFNTGSQREHLHVLNSYCAEYTKLRKEHLKARDEVDKKASEIEVKGTTIGQHISSVNKIIDPLCNFEYLAETSKTDGELLFFKIVYSTMYDEVKKNADVIKLSKQIKGLEDCIGDLNIFLYFKDRDLKVKDLNSLLDKNNFKFSKRKKIRNEFDRICKSTNGNERFAAIEMAVKNFNLGYIFRQIEAVDAPLDSANVAGKQKDFAQEKGQNQSSVSASSSSGGGGGGASAVQDTADISREDLKQLILSTFFGGHGHPKTEHQRVKRWNGAITPELIRQHPQKFQNFLPAEDVYLYQQILFHAGEGASKILQSEDLVERFATKQGDGAVTMKCRMRYKLEQDGHRQKEVTGRLVFGMDKNDPHKVFHRAFHRDMWGPNNLHYLPPKIERSEEAEDEGSFELVGEIEPALLENGDLYIKYKNHSFLDGVTICQVKS